MAVALVPAPQPGLVLKLEREAAMSEKRQSHNRKSNAVKTIFIGMQNSNVKIFV